MPYGAAFTFDPDTETAVRELWRVQEEVGIHGFTPGSGYAPHMTLVLGEDGDFDGMRAALGTLARAMPPLPVTFLSLGMFAAEHGVVFLAPVTNRALIDAHAAAWETAAPHITNPLDQYRPGIWVPHVTLANRLPLEQIGPAAALLAQSALPRSGWITSILFGDFQVGGDSRLETVSLGKE